MRDGEIMQRINGVEKRLAGIYRQNIFLETRLRAYETVLSKPWAIRAMFDAKWLKAQVDRVQMEFIREHDAETMKRAEEVKEKAMKPKLTIVNSNGMVKA